MSKVAHYLQEHLSGEVMISPDARRYFSTDGSILTVTPALVVYPRNENDVRKTARFSWQLAERGRVIPITARGFGTNQVGGALGTGIIMAFPAHMHRILELDDKSGTVIVEAGTNYGKLQQTLQTHERFLPPAPSGLEYCTVGGAVGDNTSGDKSSKYGTTRDYVKSLRVVLANGEVIETGRLNKRDFSKKLGLATFEGEIYRALDALLEENRELVEKTRLPLPKNTAGYDLADIKRKDGSFDLTPLFVGAQGTLGLVTEVTLDTEPYAAATTLLVGLFDDLPKMQEAVKHLRALPELPSSLEMVDGHMLTAVDRINPNLLKDTLTAPFPKAVLFVEFDNPSDRVRKRLAKKARKIMEKLTTSIQVEEDLERQEQLWKVRHASSTILAHGEANARAVPIIEDGVVPIDRLAEYMESVYQMFQKYHLVVAAWGHAGEGNIHLHPFLDLSQVGDRQKAFRLMDEYYTLIISLGGSTSGEYGDGRLRALYLEKLYGPEVYSLFQKVKQICDPYGTLNPGVKVNVTPEMVKSLLRPNYTMGHLYDHLPRS